MVRRRWWVWSAAGLVVLAGAGVTVVALTGDDRTPVVAPAIATVDRGTVTTEVATTGKVEPAQTRSLSFAAAGTVETLKVSAGSAVTAGQVLATIDDANAAEAVDNARDSVTAAKDALTEARDAAEEAEQTGCDTTAAPDAPPSPGPSGPEGVRPSSACGTQDQQGRSGDAGGDQIFSAQQRLHRAEVTLAGAEDALDGTTITAPIAGKVVSVSGSVGSSVRAGAAFVTLAGDTMQISADFPEADAGRLAAGQKAAVTLPGRDDPVRATVIQVDPAGTSDGTMVRFGVVLAFDKAPAGLLIGQSAALRVTTGAAEDVLRVPSAAVHDVAGGDGTVSRGGTPVRIGVGLRGDQFTEVTSGLRDGDQVLAGW